MYTKEFCLTVANGRAEQDPEEAARAMKESNAQTRTALQWLQTLINSPTVEWNPDQRAAAQAAHDAALVAVGPLAPPPVRPPGMAVQALAGEIVAALLADELNGGYDLTAGMFGPSFSGLVRRWAAAEWHALKCDVPPPGWECSRPKGHPGPCAATEAKTCNCTRALAYPRPCDCAGGPDHG